jgi:HSP20 family protein
MLRDPFADTLSLRQAMDRLFEQSLPRSDRGWMAVDVSETPSELVIKAALPGVKPEDVDITIDGDILTLTIPKVEKAEVKHLKVHPA